MENTKLLGATEILKQAWGVYKSRWKTFTGILFVLYAALGLFMLLGLGFVFTAFTAGEAVLSGIAIAVFVIAIILLGAWSQVALFYAAKDSEEKIGIKESFRRAKPKIFSYVWITILTGLVIFAGFILLIIPGIIFSIWYSFGAFILVSEDLRGMSALKKSKEYVKGKWWATFWRLIFLTIIYMLISMLLAFIFGNTSGIKSVLDFAMGIIAGPLYVIYFFLLYRNLKEINSAAAASVSN